MLTSGTITEGFERCNLDRILMDALLYEPMEWFEQR